MELETLVLASFPQTLLFSGGQRRRTNINWPPLPPPYLYTPATQANINSNGGHCVITVHHVK